MPFWANFLRSLVAVEIGNVIYFVLLMRRLPASAQHRVSRIDVGLVIDFWICVVIWGALAMLGRYRRKSLSGQRRR